MCQTAQAIGIQKTFRFRITRVPASRLIFINMASLESNAVYDSWVIKNNSVNEEIFFLNSGTNGKADYFPEHAFSK